MTDQNNKIDPVSMFMGETAQALKGINENMTAMVKRQDTMVSDLGVIKGDVQVLKNKDSRLCSEIDKINDNCEKRRNDIYSKINTLFSRVNKASGGFSFAKVFIPIIISIMVLVVSVLSFMSHKEVQDIKVHIKSGGLRDTLIQYPIPLIPDLKPPK